MKSSSSGRDFHTLIEAIKTSEVLENRIQLLKELEDLDWEKSSVNYLFESLSIFWEDFTCLDISQCTLNRTILHVATKYLDSDISGCLLQFLLLGTKANIWCRKHLKMTLMSTEDSQEEEHCVFFYQLVLDLLRYSSASYSALARYPVPTDKDWVLSLENFILEQFAMMKDLVSEIKRIQLGSDFMKAVQSTLDSATRLCKIYCNDVNWDTYHPKADSINIKDFETIENGDSVIHVINCTVEKLCELGVLAASDGGSLVSLLNMSWKGVVSLLQLGKGALAAKVDVVRVIKNLISLANESLRCAAETWSSSAVTETVSVAEAKRIFLPVKFYLINAVRIISQYQTQALALYKDISLCVVTILAFRISLGVVENLKSAGEVLAEVLEPTSLHLLNSVLNSAQVKQTTKFEILEWLFSEESANEAESESNIVNLPKTIHRVGSSVVNEGKLYSLGKVTLFIHFLKCSADLEDDLRLGVARKLRWIIDTLVDEDVYCSVLVLQTPSASSSSQNQELTYQPMFCTLLHALKIFTIVVASSSSMAWEEIESFLIEYIFHPHVLCWNVVSELWCFVLRHAEAEVITDVFVKLCSILTSTSQESVHSPDSPLRKTARLICFLLSYGSQSVVDRLYCSIFESKHAQISSNVQMALLMEGFPLDLLSAENKDIAKQRIVTQYLDFLESPEEKSTEGSDSGIYGAPVFMLCAALHSLQIHLSDLDSHTLKFLITVIEKCKTSTDKAAQDKYRGLLSELLCMISNMKHMYLLDEMEQVILELQKLFVSNQPISGNEKLFLCKSNLASFMAGLSHLELSDGDDNPRTSAVWELYHMLLRERHWAFVHLAITAFGYFAAHTTCNQLWRFVPQDAALSFDLESGNDEDEERFMSELKAVLEKEAKCMSLQPTPDQFKMLIKEGKLLKESIQNRCLQVGDSEAKSCDLMDIDDGDEKQPNKKRKFPDGICKGMELLQSGLKIMFDGLSRWEHHHDECKDVREKFLNHFSQLEDAIAHLVSLADSG